MCKGVSEPHGIPHKFIEGVLVWTLKQLLVVDDVRDELAFRGERAPIGAWERCQENRFASGRAVACAARLSRSPIQSSEQFAQREPDFWHAGAGEDGVSFDHRALWEDAAAGVAIEFHLPFSREDDPVFLHTRLAVERGDGAVFRRRRDSYTGPYRSMSDPALSSPARWHRVC